MCKAAGTGGNLSDDIRLVRGIGPKKAQLFYKLGVFTLKDALSYYPVGYEDRTEVHSISQAAEGGKMLFFAAVGTTPKTVRIRKGMEITSFRIFDGTGVLPVTFYNNKYAARRVTQGASYYFYGGVAGNGGKRTLVNPEIEAPSQEGRRTRRILPVYPLTNGLREGDVSAVVAAALACLPESLPDVLPQSIRQERKLLTGVDGLRRIHRPETREDIAAARERLIYEELFLLSVGLRLLKKRREKVPGLQFSACDSETFLQALPYALTNAQRRVVAECAADLAGEKPMNRLVQGDVGSGKTAIAAAACFFAASSGFQAAVMAPTEILAHQHAAALEPVFRALGVTACVLTAGMKTKEKQEMEARIAAGRVQVVIGTHALIQERIRFYRLGLAVIDEQHRFGVAQRAALAEKGAAVNLLVMSATPIPRSLALLLYGDLDLSVLDELPPGRKPVETYAVTEKLRRRIYAFMEKQMEAGGQIYVVCPAVEEGELSVKDVRSHAGALQKVFPHRRIGMLYGKMKPAEKEAAMQAFARGETDILVATTVIEVGVNVPNASLMVVEDADRFGLSQLHQLRGRVGRGRRQSYAVLFGADKGEKAAERLKILCKSADGFEIAQADLVQRGPGEFFGARQSGLPPLKLADFARDMELLNSAALDAETIVQQDGALKKYPLLQERIAQLFSKADGAVFN